MNLRKNAIFASFAVAVLLAFTQAASATTYSAVYVYGDSLSDNGNLYTADGGIDPLSPPYYNGRFSNGPVAVEQLAALLGVPLIDYAWGGATTGVGNIGDGGTQSSLGSFGLPGMLSELAMYPAPTPTSLTVVWGGADDFGLVTPTSTLSEIDTIIATAVSDIDTIVATLQAAGVTHILVPDVPDLGLTPEYDTNPTISAEASEFSFFYDEALESSLPSDVTFVDTYGLLDEVNANPAAFGFANATTPCLNGTTICSDPGGYVFWDDIHPTTAADALLAQDFYTAVTPEPSSIVMLGTGIAGLAGMLRRRKAVKASC